MPSITYQGKLPPPEEFQKQLAEVMTNANPVDDLLHLANGLWQFEGQYQLSSAEFYSGYQAGSLDDELQHCIEWVAKYETFLKTKRRLESASCACCGSARDARAGRMSLYSYLVRLEAILYSRQDITIEHLQVDVATVGTLFKCELRFRDGSRLSVTEQLEPVGQRDFRRLAYKLNYLDKNDHLVFRYDNAPHYPQLPTFPAHKHMGNSVVEAEPPDLADVLAEIDAMVYQDSGTAKPE